MKKLLIFASGTKTGGGSGFENLANQHLVLGANIIGVVSNHAEGGVKEKAQRLGIPFIHFPAPWSTGAYQDIVRKAGADFVALSGWLKLVTGLDPRTTFNIHPGPLPRFGGEGMYGHHVHEAVLAAGMSHSTVSMHFVTPVYDEGPLFFRYPVPVLPGDTAETLGARVNAAEHAWQPFMTRLVVSGEIRWDGKDKNSLLVPENIRSLNEVNAEEFETVV